MEQAILDGLQSLKLTKEEEEGIQLSTPSRAEWLEECQLSLFGKLLSNRQQNQRALKSTLRSAWKMGSDLRIVEVGNDILHFKFNSKYQMEWVEKNGPWNFDNNLLLLCQWRKGLTAANISFSHSSFWVQIWGIPFELMIEETGKAVGDKIGKLLEVDKGSWQLDQAKYMRVRVEIPLNKPLQRGGYLLNEEGEKVWVTFKYERLPTVCYKCGILGHDDRHCEELGLEQVMEYQYDDWIRANSNSRGGPERMKSRKGMQHQPGTLGRTMEQPLMAENAMVGSGGGSGQNDGARGVEKQLGQGDVNSDAWSGSQAAVHSGRWDNSTVSPLTADTSELTRGTRKYLNFEIKGSEGDAPGCDQPDVGFQNGPILEEMEVTSPIKPGIDFSEFKKNGFLDVGCKDKNKEPKTIGSWKRRAREKGLFKEEAMLGQKKSSGLKKAGELEILEAEEKRKMKRK